MQQTIIHPEPRAKVNDKENLTNKLRKYKMSGKSEREEKGEYNSSLYSTLHKNIYRSEMQQKEKSLGAADMRCTSLRSSQSHSLMFSTWRNA